MPIFVNLYLFAICGKENGCFYYVYPLVGISNSFPVGFFFFPFHLNAMWSRNSYLCDIIVVRTEH
ncbi:hypothetical protein K450DRAFT_257483 [Umbelopsis ramanniana AG]|uniref:Uncharacterized protein n=1 Tax=Umbelopsis ramanniana AG TaxID=1314678 RepID=A0AAD5HAZ3_UMBRA|nr:uncharacterized protein K450DRAFT_257483 [Umbelopsis ramanniana AG]KAI8576269.1 hypothetical protein K450DRAFT_257483 [Umbelopsis ramanniana AG]